MTASKLEITRIVKANRETIFSALTDPKIMSQWFFADPTWSVEAQVDLRVGGAYALTMRAPSGEEFPTDGVYEVIEPPGRLVFTWNSYLVAGTRVTIELSEVAEGQTQLKLVHDRLGEDPVVAERHHGGWLGCLSMLDVHLTQ